MITIEKSVEILGVDPKVVYELIQERDYSWRIRRTLFIFKSFFYIIKQCFGPLPVDWYCHPNH